MLFQTRSVPPNVTRLCRRALFSASTSALLMLNALRSVLGLKIAKSLTYVLCDEASPALGQVGLQLLWQAHERIFAQGG